LRATVDSVLSETSVRFFKSSQYGDDARLRPQ
jgi:hypothetical protein